MALAQQGIRGEDINGQYEAVGTGRRFANYEDYAAYTSSALYQQELAALGLSRNPGTGSISQTGANGLLSDDPNDLLPGQTDDPYNNLARDINIADGLDPDISNRNQTPGVLASPVPSQFTQDEAYEIFLSSPGQQADVDALTSNLQQLYPELTSTDVWGNIAHDRELIAKVASSGLVGQDWVNAALSRVDSLGSGQEPPLGGDQAFTDQELQNIIDAQVDWYRNGAQNEETWYGSARALQNLGLSDQQIISYLGTVPRDDPRGTPPPQGTKPETQLLSIRNTFIDQMKAVAADKQQGNWTQVNTIDLANKLKSDILRIMGPSGWDDNMAREYVATVMQDLSNGVYDNGGIGIGPVTGTGTGAGTGTGTGTGTGIGTGGNGGGIGTGGNGGGIGTGGNGGFDLGGTPPQDYINQLGGDDTVTQNFQDYGAGGQINPLNLNPAAQASFQDTAFSTLRNRYPGLNNLGGGVQNNLQTQAQQIARMLELQASLGGLGSLSENGGNLFWSGAGGTPANINNQDLIRNQTLGGLGIGGGMGGQGRSFRDFVNASSRMFNDPNAPQGQVNATRDALGFTDNTSTAQAYGGFVNQYLLPRISQLPNGLQQLMGNIVRGAFDDIVAANPATAQLNQSDFLRQIMGNAF